MNRDRTNALVASAYNLVAAADPFIRHMYPNGMRPVEAANLSANARLAWVLTYEQRLLKMTAAQQRRSLFTLAEVQEALIELRAAFLHAPIKGRDEAVTFVQTLIRAGMDFHFDDSPETILNWRTGQPLFAPSEYDAVRARVRELFRFLRDPFTTALDEMRRAGR